MKENNYKVVKNPLGIYYFSFAYCHATAIGAYFFGVILGFLVYLFLSYDSPEQGFTSRDILMNMLISLAFTAPCFFIGLIMTLRIKRVKKIMTCGEKVDGEIISYYRIHLSNGKKNHLSNKPNYTILNIKFNYYGEHCYSTNVGHKLPNKVLASHTCKVYLYDDFVFVTGFELRKRGMPEITFKQIGLADISIYKL